MNTRTLAVIVGLAVCPATAWAQSVPDPAEAAMLHVGALALTPRFGLRNLGIDTNVFNLAEDPQRDVTATLTGGSDMWFRVGRAYLAGRTVVDWHYFQEASGQRSLDFTQHGRLDLDLMRLVPRLGGEIVHTRQRPNEEFDQRVQQRNVAAFGGVMVPIGAKARLDVEMRREEYDYSQGSASDAEIASALNRTSRRVILQAGFDLTPLTRFVVQADARTDRFAYTQERDGNSVRVMPGLEIQPSALVSGKAFVGYRNLKTPSASVPDFEGVVAAVELKYVAADVFRITGEVKRDLDYSLDLDDSVYVSTTMGVEVVQALGLSWDVVGRIRHAALAYQEVDPSAGRTDRMWIFGVGFGRRIGSGFRVGFDVDYADRSSVLPDRAFDGLRYGISVTYGY
jgi:hypothetical protein